MKMPQTPPKTPSIEEVMKFYFDANVILEKVRELEKRLDKIEKATKIKLYYNCRE